MPPVELAPGHEKELRRLRRIADLFDNEFRIPLTRWRFGIDAILGLVPGAGDVAGALFALYGLWVANLVGAPASVQARMVLQVAVDVLAGMVPVVGDIFDIAFKAHVRNRRLLEGWLARPHTVRRQSKALLIVVPTAAVTLFLASGALAIWGFVTLVRWLADLT
jgi:hypothetical protein